jgi:hypothetical protein
VFTGSFLRSIRASFDFEEVRFRHTMIRAALRRVAQQHLNAMLEEDGIAPILRLAPIDHRALEAWRSTWPSHRWDWSAVMARAERRNARVEIAIWHGAALCGLAWGRISDGRDVVRIDLIERNPGPSPLKGWIALIAAETAGITAQAFEATRVRFHAPLPGATPIYEGLGFAYVRGRPAYCEKVLP